jgi:hypothetical protein
MEDGFRNSRLTDKGALLICDMAENLAITLRGVVAHAHAVAQCMGKTPEDWKSTPFDDREALFRDHRRKRSGHTCGD